MLKNSLITIKDLIPLEDNEALLKFAESLPDEK
jgi:hypothetical protein